MTNHSLLLLLAGAAIAGCRARANSASPEVASAFPPGFSARDIAEGDSLFNNRSCIKCHGRGGKGTVNGPTFLSGTWQHGNGSIAAISRTIETGVPLDSIRDSTFKLDMHPNPSNFTPSQIRAVAAYVWTLSRARVVRTPSL